MDREQIKEVLRDVFRGRYPLRDLGDWVSLPCPLAPWKHDSGVDTNPSFGVLVKDSGTSIVNCFTCKTKKPFHAFLEEYANLSGDDIDAIVKEVEQGEFLGPTRLEGWDAIKSQNMGEVRMPIDEGRYMDIYPSAAGHPYVRNRGVSDKTVELLELRFDPGDYSSDGEPRILFPVRGTDGLLYGFSGRATHPGARLKVRDYYGLKKANNLLGSHLAVQDARDYVLAVEGLFDYANAWECGYPACAVMHSTVTNPQRDIFLEIGKKVYCFFDDDRAGQTGGDTLYQMIKQYLPVLQTTYPEVWVEDHDHPEGGEWLSDPGQMEPEEFEEMIKGASLRIDPPRRRWPTELGGGYGNRYA